LRRFLSNPVRGFPKKEYAGEIFGRRRERFPKNSPRTPKKFLRVPPPLKKRLPRKIRGNAQKTQGNEKFSPWR
jgi:hypothetical protein